MNEIRIQRDWLRAWSLDGRPITFAWQHVTMFRPHPTGGTEVFTVNGEPFVITATYDDLCRSLDPSWEPPVRQE